MDCCKMRISYIIIEYHSVEDSMACCDSIVNAVPANWNYEIIISSNSVYSVEQQQKILLNNKTVKWIFNDKNGGFAYAMNQGLKNATGDILVIMNPDVRIQKGLLEMLSYFQSQKKIGIIAPKIVNKCNVLQDSFREFITPQNFLLRHLKRLFSKAEIGTDEKPKDVDWVIGAFMMTSRSAYEKVGGMDDKYFMYCEDMDWCKRMHLQGYSVIYYPQTVIEYEGTRSARHSWKYAWIFLKSLFRYWTKFLW